MRSFMVASLALVAKLEAEFLKFAFEVVVRRVKFWVATGGIYRRSVDEAGRMAS